MPMPTTIDGRTAIQSSLVRAWGLEGYARIQCTARKTDVSSDVDFQRFYNRFYRVRRNAEWQTHYYAIMEREKPNPDTSFESVLREMHELTGNVEASFTSKMIATLHPNRPIWDSLVLARLDLRLRGTTTQAKLENAVEVYGKIVSWYETYLATDDTEKNIRLFDELLPGYAWLTPVKKIDFLLWSER